MNMNELMKNHITDIMSRKRLINCPKCGVRLDKVENRYMGIPVLTVFYCRKCGFTEGGSENEE